MGLNNTVALYGVDIWKVKGYEELSDANKEIFEVFIENFFISLGLESRASLVLLGIYWVDHNEYLIKEDPQDDFYIVCGCTINTIDRDGNKVLHRKWVDEDYKDYPILDIETSEYLCVEYEHFGRKEWLHIIDGGKQWY